MGNVTKILPICPHVIFHRSKIDTSYSEDDKRNFRHVGFAKHGNCANQGKNSKQPPYPTSQNQMSVIFDNLLMYRLLLQQ